MKYSIVDGAVHEAQPGLSGICRDCGAITIARCGRKNVWHWAHKGRRDCDPWREPETPWHRGWKALFPVNWQERTCWADNDDKYHRADVKTDSGWVIEFQHSAIAPEEARIREAFYKKMVWIIDGKRRKNDHKQFDEAMRNSRPVSDGKSHAWITQYNNSRLLHEWAASNVQVFLDFGQDALHCILPGSTTDRSAVIPVSRDQFIRTHLEGTYAFEKRVIIDTPRPRPAPLPGFQRYLARTRRRRRRL